MRNHYIYSLPLFHSNSDPYCRYDCAFTSQINLTENATSIQHSFTSCKWKRCKAPIGGAIYFTPSNSQSSLIITDSQFLSCEATSTLGGGLYLSGVGTLQITKSSFALCTAQATEDSGGGAMQFEKTSVSLLISSNDFVECSSENDAGSISCTQSTFTQSCCPFVNNRFVSCHSKNSTNGGGGGILLWSNPTAFGVSNNIFARCTSLLMGGGIHLALPSDRYSSFIKFCFFASNSSPHGKDVHIKFSQTENWNNVFLHSFTTDTTKSLGKNWPNPTDVSGDSSIWLPLTNNSENFCYYCTLAKTASYKQ